MDEVRRIGDWRCSMAYADGLVFVGEADFTGYDGIYALDASTSETVWNYPGGSSPAVSRSMVFTVGKGKVYAFGDASNNTTGGFAL